MWSAREATTSRRRRPGAILTRPLAVATLIALPAPLAGIDPLRPAAAESLPAAFAPPAPAAAMSFEKDRTCPRGAAAFAPPAPAAA